MSIGCADVNNVAQADEAVLKVAQLVQANPESHDCQMLLLRLFLQIQASSPAIRQGLQPQTAQHILHNLNQMNRDRDGVGNLVVQSYLEWLEEAIEGRGGTWQQMSRAEQNEYLDTLWQVAIEGTKEEGGIVDADLAERSEVLYTRARKSGMK